MAFQVDQKVRIKESAFGDSQEPEDVAARGQVVTLTLDLSEVFGADWKGCWEGELENGKPVQLIESEIEEVEG